MQGTSKENGGRRHPSYKGVRQRKNSDKWVSEIREPKKPNRIWLGTFSTPEMAAIAYDVAALALKGVQTELNFPNSASSLPVPNSMSPGDIQAAAASAAATFGAAGDAIVKAKDDGNSGLSGAECTMNGSYNNGDDDGNVNVMSNGFMDDDMVFDMPNVYMDMAEGMLLSPPHHEFAFDSAYDGDHHHAHGYNGADDYLWNFP